MYQKKIKTFLIIILLAVDAALALLLIRQHNLKVYDKDTVANVREIMLSSGIEVGEDIISAKTADMKICRSASAESITDNIASLLLGGKITQTFLIPDGYVYYTESGESLTAYSDSAFTYSNGVTGGNYRTGEAIEDKEELDGIKKTLSSFFGAGSSEENLDFTLDVARRMDVGIFAHITQTLDGISIANNTLDCILDGETLLFADGSWCFLPISEKNPAHLFDSVNILFIEKGEKTKADADGAEDTAEITDTPEKCTVVSMTQCYRASLASGKNAFSFIPFWKIEYDNGSVSFYNAVNGEKS